MLNGGWIKLHRSLVEWEWYDDANTMRLYIHLMLTVSIQEQKWRNIIVPRGARIAGLAVLAQETGLTIAKVRKALSNLETTGEITRTTHGKYTVIALNHFDQYQNDSNENAAKTQDDDNENATKSQQYKKEKKVKKEKKDEKCVCGRTESHTPQQQYLDLEEICAMAQEMGYAWTRQEAERFLAYNRDRGRSSGWEYAMQRWEEQRRRYGGGKSSREEEEMTQEEIDQMNDYLSLVNRFRSV